jgi:hypothetical protein
VPANFSVMAPMIGRGVSSFNRWPPFLSLKADPQSTTLFNPNHASFT